MLQKVSKSLTEVTAAAVSHVHASNCARLGALRFTMKLLPRSRHGKHDSKSRHGGAAHDAAPSSLIGRDDEGFLDLDGERDMMEGLDGPQVHEKKVDQDFVNKFDDDFDESDMKIR